MVGYEPLLERCTDARGISTNTAFKKVNKQKAEFGELNQHCIRAQV